MIGIGRATFVLTMGITLAAAGAAKAEDTLHYDYFSPYLQRTDKIYPGAGDAKDVNAATHVIDPWPRNVGDRNIPANGERMVGAVTRYRDTSKLPQAPAPLAPVDMGTSGVYSGGSSGSSSGSGGGGTGAR
jgi:hypothetical protein